MNDPSLRINRRSLLKSLGVGSTAGLLGLAAARVPLRAASPEAHGAPDHDKIKITRVRAIHTAPYGINLVIVKVETDTPGLYGVGCATFTQRSHAVVTAVDQFLDPFFRGRPVTRIEDNWQMAYQGSYWRNGPVLNNALSGVDQALWDIKGKLAGMPVYDLLGGKCRFAVDAYGHATGRTVEEVIESVAEFKELGYRNIRIQLGGYGSTHLTAQPAYQKAGFGRPQDQTITPQVYKQGTIDIFKAARETYGDSIELLHDMHERLQPMDAIDLLRRIEEYRPFFMEDPLSPENMGWFPQLRQQTSVPIAMGELFNSPHEWLEPMADRLFDFIRIHVSQIGGITPAMKVARLGEWFNVRTAWHGPPDTSPVGHAAHCHIDLAVWNFGVQEIWRFGEVVDEVFPGMPQIKDGYIHVSESPGLGIDIDEAQAAKYPPVVYNYNWTQLRGRDGTPVRP